MGDDEELQIGGVVAGMKTENNKIVENSQTVTTQAQVMNFIPTQMMIDPTTGQVVTLVGAPM